MIAQAGDVVFSGKRAFNFYSRIVMHVTGSRWSHCFPVVGDALGELSALESDLDVTLVSFHQQYEVKNADYYEVWRPVKASADDVALTGKYVYDNFAEEPYGFFKPIWFLLRAVLARVGIHLSRNWFHGGIVCSGLLYWYISALNKEYAEALYGLSADTASPQDLYAIVKARPDLFQYVGART